jgi:hypothetical protein
MNKQNIVLLTNQLTSLGFPNAGYQLLKLVSFGIEQLTVTHKIIKGNDLVCFLLYFEKDTKQNLYSLIYYDATLQKETELLEATINGIDLKELEAKMKGIDWKEAFELHTDKPFDIDDKSIWQEQEKIEHAFADLSALDITEEGKQIAATLRSKYWGDIQIPDGFIELGSVKNKSETTQRFYCFNSESAISAEEAFRFLNNRWMEKQMQVKRKRLEVEKTTQVNVGISGKGVAGKKANKHSKKSARVE